MSVTLFHTIVDRALYVAAPRRIVASMGLLVLLGNTSGCQVLNDLNRTGGNSDKGYFEVSPDADLAKGSHLEYTVGDYESISGTAGNIGLEAPSSEDRGVAELVSFDDFGLIELKGVNAGETRISFTARADDESIDDGFNVRVVSVTDLKFVPCSTAGAYVRGEQVRLPYQFNADASKDVLGLGYYPFKTSPTTGLSLRKEASTTTFFSLYVEDDAPSEVTIRSTLSGDDSALALYIVDQSDFDGVAPLSTMTTDRGQSFTVDLRPLVNGRPVCSNVRRVLRSLNPNACSIANAIDGELDTSELSATVSLDAVDFCLLSLEFPGADVTYSFDPIIVTEPASSSGGSSIDWDD